MIAEILFTNIAEHLTTYFYWVSAQNCDFSKIRHMLPDDGPGGLTHVGAIMKYFNYDILTFFICNKEVHLLVIRT